MRDAPFFERAVFGTQINQVRFICKLVLGSGFVASLYSKVAQQHAPTSGNRKFVGEWSEHLTSGDFM
jgi:hypothetical protein